MRPRSAIARLVDGALEIRAAEGAGCAYIQPREQADRWQIGEAQLLREVAEAVERGEIAVSAIEVVAR